MRCCIANWCKVFYTNEVKESEERERDNEREWREWKKRKEKNDRDWKSNFSVVLV